MAWHRPAITWTNADAVHQRIHAALRVDELTHWGWVTHICISNLTIIDSDYGLSPARRQAIIWTNAVFLLIGPLGTNFSEILIEFHTFSFKKMHLEMPSGKCWPFCLSLNVLTNGYRYASRILNEFNQDLLLIFCALTYASKNHQPFMYIIINFNDE